MAQLREGSIIKKASGDEVIATMSDMNGLMPISGGVLENYGEKLIIFSEVILNVDIDLSLGSVFYQETVRPNVHNYYFINTPSEQASSFTLIIERIAGSLSSYAFPSSVKWQGGEIPDLTTANKTYVLTFMTVDGGTTWLGMFGGEF